MGVRDTCILVPSENFNIKLDAKAYIISAITLGIERLKMSSFSTKHCFCLRMTIDLCHILCYLRGYIAASINNVQRIFQKIQLHRFKDMSVEQTRRIWVTWGCR